MKHKTRTKALSWLLSLALMLSLLPGMSLTAFAADATELAADTTTWVNGDYVVPADGVTLSGHITVNGIVNLTLTSGATLTANMGITLGENARLNVSGEGAMVVNGSNGNTNSTIAGTGTLVLTGGTLTATGGNGQNLSGTQQTGNTGGAAINGAVTVSGGTLAATGGNGGSCNGSTLSENKGGTGGAAIGGSVTINSGTLTATGGNGGSITITNYGSENRGGAGGAAIGGAVTINGGTMTVTKGGNGTLSQKNGSNNTVGTGSAGYSGTLTLGANVKLYEGTDNTGTVLDGNDSDSRVYSGEKKASMYAYGPDVVAESDKSSLNNAINVAETMYGRIKNNAEYTDIASALKTALDPAKEVAYNDEAGQDPVDTATQNLIDAIITAEASQSMITARTTWEEETYFVPMFGETVAGHITVNGTVNLILTEGATLTANMGITLSDGATLNVSGEGAMVVKGSDGNANSTVAGTGEIVLKSGTLTAIGGTGGSVGANKMNVTANAGGAAINGAVIVNGGTVTATGGTGGSIGDYPYNNKGGAGGAAINGAVTVNGGTVTTTNGAAGRFGTGNSGSTVGAGGAGYSGTLTLGKNVKLYEGTEANSEKLLDGNDGASRVYEGDKKASMYAYGPDVTPHTHRFTCTLSDDGTTITATCPGKAENEDLDCTLANISATLTLGAPPEGDPGAGAQITDEYKIRNGAKISYFNVDANGNKTGDALGSAPTVAGKYWAEITLGEGNNAATAHVVYDVVPVASIGDKDYGTFQAAIDDIQDGDKVTLKTDIKGCFTFNKSGVTATLDLNGHTIDGDQKGTVLTIQNGTLILDDSSEGKTGVITNGTQGVAVNGSGTFKMNAGTIEGNIGNVNGAAASVNNGATFEMIGGTIQYNATTSATGGVLLNGGSHFLMSGGVVQYNTGSQYGGLGIAGVQPKFSRTAVVKGNVMGGTITKTETGYTLTGGTPCDVRNTSATAKIEVAGALQEGAQIGVYNYTNGNVITTGYKTYHENDDADAFFFSDDAAQGIGKNEDGELVFCYSITIQPSSNGTVTADKAKAKPGDTVTLTATSSDSYGYALQTITVKNASNGDVPVTGEGNTRTFTMPSSNVTVSAVFSELTPYTVFYKTSNSVSSVKCKIDGDNTEYAMTQNASLGGVTCWALRFMAADGKTQIPIAFKEGNADYGSADNRSVVETPDGSGDIVVVKGDANAFILALSKGTESEDSSVDFYLVTSNTASVSVPNPTREGYTFTGWEYTSFATVPATTNTINAGSGSTSIPVSGQIAGSTILSAAWKPVTVTVTFTGEGINVPEQELTYAASATKPADPTRSGYAFVGWAVAEKSVQRVNDGTNDVDRVLGVGSSFDFENTKIISDLTLKPVWKHVHSYGYFYITHPFFNGKLNSLSKYEEYLHIKMCTTDGCGDLEVEPHDYDWLGRCKTCGYVSNKGTVFLDTYTDNTKGFGYMLRKNTELELQSAEVEGDKRFSKWQYALSTNPSADDWKDLSTSPVASLAIPRDMSVKAVYTTNTNPYLSLYSFLYDGHLYFEFDYNLPMGWKVKDAYVLSGNNWDLRYMKIKENGPADVRFAYETKNAVTTYGKTTMRNKMLSGKAFTINGYSDLRVTRPDVIGRTGSILDGYHANNINRENGNWYFYAMGVVRCVNAQGQQQLLVTEPIWASRNNQTDSYAG